MAASLPPRPPKPGAPPPPTHHKAPLKLSQLERRELALLDETCARIKDIVPPVPYIVRVPVMPDKEYRHYSRQESLAFTMGGIFGRDEESFQYRSFCFRDPLESVLYLQSGEFDGSQPRQELERRKPDANTTASVGANPKKSLSDYNAMKNGGTPKKRSAEPHSTKPVQAAVKDSQEATKQPVPPKPAATVPHKRPASEAAQPEKPEKRRKEAGPEVRQNPQPARVDSPPSAENTASHDGTPHGLPPLLSPVHQPDETRHGLPSLLSPTLPPQVLQALEERELKKSKQDEPTPSEPSSTKPSQPSAPIEKQPAEAQRNSAKTNGVAPAFFVPAIRSSTHTEAAEKSNSRLLVKIKYPKRAAKPLAAILKLPPSKKAQARLHIEKREKEAAALEQEKAPSIEKKSAQKPAKEHPATAESSLLNGGKIKVRHAVKSSPKVTQVAITDKRPTSMAKPPEKRPRVDDDETLRIAPKGSKPSSEGTDTPAQQQQCTPPSTSKSSTHKSTEPLTTPRKNTASKAIRSDSTERNGTAPTPAASTPTSMKRDIKATPTPSSSRHVDVKATPTSAPASGLPRPSKRSVQLQSLGRTLKRELEKATAERKPGNHKFCAVLMLECLLSFIAAFGAQDLERRSAVENTWKTMLPITFQYEYFTKKTPHLDGFRHYLCMVMSSTVADHVTSRVEREKAAAHDSPQATPQSRAADNAALLAESFRFVNAALMHARATLSYDVIQKDFPKTFACRETDYKRQREPEKLSASGPYFLPIGTDTTPLQAVRFGLRLLSEYCEKEKIDYTFRLKLE